MTSKGIQRDTVTASAVLAALAIPLALAMGNLSIGIGLAAGLVAGAFNARAVAGVLERNVPFVAGTIVRLVFFSFTAILVAMVLRTDAWSVLLGVGAAQAVMVAASIRQGLRA